MTKKLKTSYISIDDDSFMSRGSLFFLLFLNYNSPERFTRNQNVEFMDILVSNISITPYILAY